MVLGRWHPGILGLLWVADLSLLPLLIPANAANSDLVIATGLWLVPTALLLAVTWLWHKHAGPRGG